MAHLKKEDCQTFRAILGFKFRRKNLVLSLNSKHFIYALSI